MRVRQRARKGEGTFHHILHPQEAPHCLELKIMQLLDDVMCSRRGGNWRRDSAARGTAFGHKSRDTIGIRRSARKLVCTCLTPVEEYVRRHIRIHLNTSE